MSNSWWSRMIKSQALQRTTPSSAGIGPSSQGERGILYVRLSAFPARPAHLVDETVRPLLVEPDHPIPRVCRFMPSNPCGAVEHGRNYQRLTRLRCILIRCAIRRRHSSYSPLANDHPFATLNHFSRFWNPERVRLPEAWYKTIRWCPLSKRRLRATVRLLAAHAPSLYVRSSDPPCV
jgi:hypothetical protein